MDGSVPVAVRENNGGTAASLRRSWQSRRKIVKYHGAGALLWHLAADCVAPLGVAKHLTLFQRDLTQEITTIETKLDPLVVAGSEVDAELIAAQIAADFQIPEDQLPVMYGKVRHRFRLGQTCFLAKMNSKVVHYTWIGLRSCPSIMDRFISLGEEEAYLAWAYTVEGWRGMRLNPAVGSQVLRLLQQAGYKRIYAFIETHNRSSQKGLQRVGWTECGQLLCFQPRWSSRCWIVSLNRDPQAKKFLQRPTCEMRRKLSTGLHGSLPSTSDRREYL